jgi:ascorbate-specific PTS system EIIC-type component UlaA
MWTGSIACVGTLVGLVLAGCAANPSVLGKLSTMELLGVMLLAAGPAMTVLALRLDRRMINALPAEDTEQGTQVRTATHDAHPRTLRSHARVGEAHADKRAHDHAV